MAKTTTQKSPKNAAHKKSAPPKAGKKAPASFAPPKKEKLKQVAFGWFADTPKAPELGKKAKRPATKAATRKSRVLRELPAKGKVPKGEVISKGRKRGDMPSYLVSFRELMAKHELAVWIARYLQDEVAGIQAANTLEAKVRDFLGFVTWMVETTGHASLQEWLPRDTQGYLRYLMSRKCAPATINRTLATLRRFARWAQDQPGGLLMRHGSPVRGIKDISTEEPECKKLEQVDVHRLFRAADRIVDLAKRSNARPRRNRAILSLLYYTGIRVSELTGLHLEQWRGKHLLGVHRKGRAITKKIYLVTSCLDALHDYLEHERHLDAQAGPKAEQALFLSNGGGAIARGHIGQILDEIAKEASKKLKEPIELHPHRLRHTFGALFRDKSGSDTETAAALGHTGLAHVGRYVRKSQKEREEAMEEIFGP